MISYHSDSHDANVSLLRQRKLKMAQLTILLLTVAALLLYVFFA